MFTYTESQITIVVTKMPQRLACGPVIFSGRESGDYIMLVVQLRQSTSPSLAIYNVYSLNKSISVRNRENLHTFE